MSRKACLLLLMVVHGKQKSEEQTYTSTFGEKELINHCPHQTIPKRQQINTMAIANSTTNTTIIIMIMIIYL